MKKVYTIFAFLIITGIAFGQRIQNPSLTATKIQITNPMKADFSKFVKNGSKTVSDTIGLAFFNLLFDGTAYYAEPGMGYPVVISGTRYGCTNRIFQDYYFAQTSDFDNYQIKCVLIHFQSKYRIGAASTISKQKVYLNKINADSSYTRMDSTSFTINQIDTANFFTVVPFSHNATALLSSTCLGIDINLVDSASSFKANHDSAVMTVDLQAGFPKMSSYTMVDSAVNSGYAFFYSYNQMYNMFVFADVVAGVADGGPFISGMQLSQNYPNPSSDGLTTISYAINKPMQVSLQIIDNTGKVVDLINEGSKAAGTYNITLNKKLAKGVYYYSLIGDGKFLTKEMVIE